MTARAFVGDRLVVATHNAGKLVEIRDLLAPYGASPVSAGDLGLPEPEETETTFVGNALLKARAAAEASGLPSLADDSGFALAALDGAPGVYSARWAETGAGRDFAAAMARVNVELGDAADRSARFICVLALVWPDGHAETFEGTVDGVAVWPPRGNHGFGYDPIFQPNGEPRTFGEMTADEKTALSHRARAFRALVDACFS